MIYSKHERDSLLNLHEISKHFGGVQALDLVDFDLRHGEIHALIGENGAGKSTLIKILAGVYQPDHGTIAMEGETVLIDQVANANNLGIRVIHQELSLAPNLSIAENIYLGREPQSWGWLLHAQMKRDAKELINALGMDEISHVETMVSDLSVAQQQLVEIARALSTDARVLILDEPTSSLSESETEMLFRTLKRLREKDVGIIYISHRLEEIVRLANRITVLRDGRSMGTQESNGINQRELIKWMVGRDIAEHFHRPTKSVGDIALSVKNLSNENIHHVEFNVHYGEIVGLAGLVGAGRSEIVRAIFGIDPIDTGTIQVEGKPVTIHCPQDALDAGIVLVPEDRRQEGLIMIQSVAFNIALPWRHRWCKGFMPDWNERHKIVNRTIDGFNIRLANPEQTVSSLSGGNQQKILVGRWMEERPKILILDEPTRGVDVGAREEMFTLIASFVESGMAVVLISSDLDEVIHLSHRLLLIRDGKIIETVPTDSTNTESVVARLTGANLEERN